MIDKFKLLLWNKIEASSKSDELDRYSRIVIFNHFINTVRDIALDSTVLPLALYFQKEEVAAACIYLGHEVFIRSKPMFHDNQVDSNKNSKFTGGQLIELYFNTPVSKLIDDLPPKT